MDGRRRIPDPAEAGRHGRRPETTPDFLLSHPSGSMRSQGAAHTTDDVDEALAMLRDGVAGMVVGALPFDTSAPAALTVPRSVIRSEGPLEPPAYYRGPSTWRPVTERVQSEDCHTGRVADAVAELAGGGPLEKVVLGRSLRLRADHPADAPSLAARFLDLSPRGDGFLVDLSPAGRGYTGHRLIGSSPELLVRRIGRRIEAFPLAGSARRTGDPETDAASADRLAASAKDLHEHSFVVDMLGEALAPLCGEYSAAPTPQVTSTRTMLHLGTPISGELRSSRTTALELARLVHPTPAVCGHPTAEAARWIAEHEGDRRFFGGTVGWCDSSGDGTWMVAIRCLELHADARRATAWAGGGIVADSVPADEFQETSAKFATVLQATEASGGGAT